MLYTGCSLTSLFLLSASEPTVLAICRAPMIALLDLRTRAKQGGRRWLVIASLLSSASSFPSPLSPPPQSITSITLSLGPTTLAQTSPRYLGDIAPAFTHHQQQQQQQQHSYSSSPPPIINASMYHSTTHRSQSHPSLASRVPPNPQPFIAINPVSHTLSLSYPTVTRTIAHPWHQTYSKINLPPP